MMIMSTSGSLANPPGSATTRTYTLPNGTRTTVRFNYAEPFYNHFKFRHQIDDHNKRRHFPISFEEIGWATKMWCNRVFAFLIAVTEVNAKLAWDYFRNEPTCRPGSDPNGMIPFRQKLIQELLNNEWVVREEEVSPRTTRPRRVSVYHQLQNPPKFTGKWDGNAWSKVATEYLQRVCSCGKRTRTHCACSKLVFYCVDCFADHKREVE
jgi:hypothetical protein